MAILGATTLTGCNSIPDFIATSTKTIYRGTSAPTGWTKLTDIDNCCLRVVASGALSPGGSNPFTDTFTTRSMSGTIGGSTLATSQIPSHNHPNGVGGSATRSPGLWSERPANNNASSGNAGSGQAHVHTLVSSDEDFSVAYSDVIRCTKT
jgi:hypothetical protein